MATADELRAQLQQLEAEDKALKEQEKFSDEKYRRDHFGKSKLYDGTKLVIVLVIIFLALIGTLGSMHFGPFAAFVMDDFVKFLSAFSPIFMTLTGSIGLGGIAKNVAKAITDKKNGESTGAAGEDLVKNGGA